MRCVWGAGSAISRDLARGGALLSSAASDRRSIGVWETDDTGGRHDRTGDDADLLRLRLTLVLSQYRAY